MCAGGECALYSAIRSAPPLHLIDTFGAGVTGVTVYQSEEGSEQLDGTYVLEPAPMYPGCLVDLSNSGDWHTTLSG